MCTEKCFELTQRPSSSVSRRAALAGGAAMVATAALGGTAEAGERRAGFPGRGRRHGLVDLTHELTTSFPAFVPGEEAVRRTVVTIEDDGYYMQEWRIIEHIGTHVDAPGHFAPGGAGARAAAGGAGRRGGGDRHRRPGGQGPGHGRHRR